MELMIDKSYLVRCEQYTRFGYGGSYDPFAARYVFRLPEAAGLPEGYTVYIDAIVAWKRDLRNDFVRDENGHLVVARYRELENGRTFRITPSNGGYEATMTENREEGKRYKRYKYTAEELYALYQGVDLTAAALSVARIDIYIEGREGNRHKILYGNRIESTDYYIGKAQGSWFYCPDLDTKRRIGSHGVKILGKIRSENEPEIRKLMSACRAALRKHKQEYSNIYGAADHVEKVIWQLKLYDEIGTPADEEINEAVRAIQRNAETAKNLIAKKLEGEQSTKEKIMSDFEASLKPYFI